MHDDRFDLPLRIVVAGPVAGLTLALQRGASGKATLVPAAASSPEVLAFDLEVTVDGALPGGGPRLLGPFVHGPPQERFVYLCVGRPGGGRVGRMKVPLGGIDWGLIEGLPPGGRIEGCVAGRNAKGGPALATVPILPPGWAYIPG
jgi:hypothetical protein